MLASGGAMTVQDRSDSGLGKGARGGICLGASLLPLLFLVIRLAHGFFFRASSATEIVPTQVAWCVTPHDLPEVLLSFYVRVEKS